MPTLYTRGHAKARHSRDFAKKPAAAELRDDGLGSTA